MNRIQSRPTASLSPMIAALATLLAGCGGDAPEPPSESSADVVAVVGDTQIRVDDIRDQIARQGTPSGDRALPERRRREALDALIWRAALYESAVAAGIDKEPEVRERWKRMLAQIHEERLRASQPEPEPIPDSLVQQHYQATIARFDEPERRRVQAILLKIPAHATPGKRAEMRARAEEIHASAASATDAEFRKLVMSHSEDQATRYSGGEFGWVDRKQAGRLPAEAVEAAFSLNEPGVAPLVETEAGFHIVRLVEIRPARRRTLEEVKAQLLRELAASLQEEREKAFRQRVLSGLTVKIDDAALARVPPPPAPSPAAAVRPPQLPASSSSTP